MSRHIAVLACAAGIVLGGLTACEERKTDAAATRFFISQLDHVPGAIREFLDLASATILLDNLIHRRRMMPVIGVFVPPVERNREYGFDLVDDYERFVIDELLPTVGRRYRISLDPKWRASVGTSLGGYVSTLRADRHLADIRLVAAMSASFQLRNRDLVNSF